MDMEDMKFLRRDSIPCWYEISFRGKNGKPGLLLRIHADFAERAKEIPANASEVFNFTRNFGFRKFVGTFGKDLGFGASLRYLGTTDGFLEYEIPTPRVKKFKKKRCGYCDGKGYDKEFERDCLYCEKGRVSYYHYDAAYAVSASLTLLFGFMRYPDAETTAKTPQLMCVDAVTIKGMQGGSLGGVYGCELANYLRSRQNGDIPEMIAAMRAVFERMDGKIPHCYEHSFHAYTQGGNGWLNVSCPGDAAGLHPADGHVNAHGGYDFASHNVDSPIQQFTLLASLAALHDLAREAK